MSSESSVSQKKTETRLKRVVSPIVRVKYTEIKLLYYHYNVV